ncbi:MaoC family dehydratase [Breoghania sp. L-A4]|uniref:MaoC family dehydratase n=1 Tax=Breoghania sp. L-A4 TaxID=2304600 RepID=UPI000E35DFD5|nr:MaoC family dehydratase [Breoghania sp. L-A4]AXS41458.1 MaoC family dehydratase [Breoghania sp. L-A4]
MRFFEDIEIGSEEALGSHTFTADEIKAYAAKFDPQPFHLDEEAAAKSHFGGLCASGWHTAAIWMKLMIAHRKRLIEENPPEAGARQAPLGPSPGFDDMKWLKPVYVGDTVRYSTRVASKRRLSSRPGWGLVSAANAGINQNGDTVFTFTSHVLVGLRGS